LDFEFIKFSLDMDDFTARPGKWRSRGNTRVIPQAFLSERALGRAYKVLAFLGLSRSVGRRGTHT